MLVGYARVSTADQNLYLQTDALKEIGCEKIYTDVISGAKAVRPGLNTAFGYLRTGDTLAVWRLDRLGRTLKELIEIVNTLEKNGIGFKSLQEGIDTTTITGRLIFHVFAALAEFEREIIRDRTGAGLKAARARGRKGGRPRKLSPAQVKAAAVMLRDRETDIEEICQGFGISKNTLYRRVNELGASHEPENHPHPPPSDLQ